MKRPIPEGVKPPEGCMILGWGKDIVIPNCGFQGWRSEDKARSWVVGWLRGTDPDCLYAADDGSEVARLNACPDPNCTDGQTWVTDLEGQPQRKDCGCQNTPDKDALIRELVVTMDKIRSLSDSNSDPWDVLATIDTVSDEVIRKARTTCPEAFGIESKLVKCTEAARKAFGHIPREPIPFEIVQPFGGECSENSSS